MNLLEQGRVYSCGENKLGQLGLGDQSNTVLVPTKVCDVQYSPVFLNTSPFHCDIYAGINYVI